MKMFSFEMLSRIFHDRFLGASRKKTTLIRLNDKYLSNMVDKMNVAEFLKVFVRKKIKFI